jgi:hypothetical protein
MKMKMKYLKDWRIFESEYWQKLKRLQALGLENPDVLRVEKWLADRARNPDDRWNMIDFDGLGLKELPDGPWHTNSLASFSGSELQRLPANLRVEGNLYLKDMPNLVELPARLQVGGDLAIFRCPKLESLPDGLQVGGELSVMDTPIRTLPQDLRVKGKLTFLDTWIPFSELMPIWKARKGPGGEGDPRMYFSGHDGPQEGPRVKEA